MTKKRTTGAKPKAAAAKSEKAEKAEALKQFREDLGLSAAVPAADAEMARQYLSSVYRQWGAERESHNSERETWDKERKRLEAEKLEALRGDYRRTALATADEAEYAQFKFWKKLLAAKA